MQFSNICARTDGVHQDYRFCAFQEIQEFKSRLLNDFDPDSWQGGRRRMLSLPEAHGLEARCVITSPAPPDTYDGDSHGERLSSALSSRKCVAHEMHGS